MRKATAALGAVISSAVILTAMAAPWAVPPPLAYDTVSGWPMRVNFRNLGNSPEHLTAVGGFPVLSTDKPLTEAQIDANFAHLKKHLDRAPTLIKSGDFVWFEIDDPDELAWIPAKTEHTTWLYLFVVLEAPRPALFNKKWVVELCLVSKTKEAFRKCETHNDIYATAVDS